MSRYVHVDAPAFRDLEEIARGLAAMGLPVARSRTRVMLEGSIECAGEPVDLRLPAGTLDAVEDFGFVHEPSGVRLVCGELDRALLEAQLLAPLHTAVTELRIRGAAELAGLDVEPTIESGSRRRLVLRRRS